MTNYLSTFLFLLLLIGCQSDAPDEMGMSDGTQPQPQAPMNGMMEQPQIDTDVSGDELELFLDASEKAREIQMEAEQEMLAVLEDEDLAVETYSMIAQSLQMGQSAEDLDVSADDMSKYESASAAIGEIGSEMDELVAAAIEDEGMPMDRFQEINMAIQQDPQLQQRVQQLFQERQGDDMMQQQPQQQ